MARGRKDRKRAGLSCFLPQRFRAADQGAGVSILSGLRFCVFRRTELDRSGHVTGMRLRQGDSADGLWQGRFWVPFEVTATRRGNLDHAQSPSPAVSTVLLVWYSPIEATTGTWANRTRDGRAAPLGLITRFRTKADFLRPVLASKHRWQRIL